MNRLASLSISLLLSCSLHAWKGTEATGDLPIFAGVLTSQEGNVFNVTNISIGRSRDSREKIMLYEMPANLKETSKGNFISVNPTEDLTTVQLELLKIKKIAIPHPHVLWKWKDKDSKRAVSIAREYIELVVTWTTGSSVHYLLKLGPEDTQRPVKIFCDVIDKPLAGVRQDGTLFCPGLKKNDLRKKGAPFPSIKLLVFDEPCFKVPTENGGAIKQNSNTKK